MAVSLTAAAGAACGTAPPSPVVQVFSRDDSMLIWCGTGTGTFSAGVVCTVTLGGNYSGVDDPPVPKFVLSTIGTPAKNAGFHVSSVSTYQVVISCTTSIAVGTSQPATAATGLGIVLSLSV